MSELFTIPESHPPRIVELRRRYDEAQTAYNEADALEDESGEAIPVHIRILLCTTKNMLMAEEARIAVQL
ncbi:hypothetical protein UFOVP301_24 [uncultured Caudovirales phage]|uniref:Uncharacterized protein n=1 Tax=uncultured Caudovirales phage TaxID=2100421 RepID=A0A6J5RYZ2_9CAUD|nr:hypothetical protein UFOVP301_24 [uncultured Caudovirales phage]CAB4150593.1 hypothetical protein UFOVP576_4 [uncultured Caudovirales phage]CAB4199586.1 hypothetical protein UFOVP1350_13 [uncultured Caudovirales phage]